LNAPKYSVIDPTGTYLFVTNSGNKSVIPFTIGATGSLTAGTPVALTGATFLNAAAVDPTSKYLYVEDSPGSGTGNLYALSIGSGGALTATINNGDPYPLGGSPMGVAVGPTGKIVAVANNFDNTLSVFTAAADGSLTADSLVETAAAPQFPVFAIGTAEAASSVAAVVTANSTAGTLSAFTVSSAGALTAVGTPFAAVTGNSQVAANRGSVTTSATAKELGGYTVNPASSTATFTQIASPFVLPGVGGSVVVDATDEYVYVADTTNKTIAAHKTSDLGLNGAPYDVTGGVLSLATDPQTTLVYALGTNTITPILTQAATGTLSVPATGQNFPGTWVAGAVSPGGKFLAAVDSSTNKIQVFSITPVRGAATDGALLKVGSGVSIPGAKTVSSLAFDPLGRFVVVTDSKVNTVTPFTIDSTGKLTAGTALTTPTGATQAVIDPNGLFLFVGVFGNPTASTPVAGGVQAYTISTTGALTAVGTPVNADLGTWGVGILNTVQ
jgi:6-phosphogluconolactonase (cycloisomerase 2 family)